MGVCHLEPRAKPCWWPSIIPSATRGRFSRHFKPRSIHGILSQSQPNVKQPKNIARGSFFISKTLSHLLSPTQNSSRSSWLHAMKQALDSVGKLIYTKVQDVSSRMPARPVKINPTMTEVYRCTTYTRVLIPRLDWSGGSSSLTVISSMDWDELFFETRHLVFFMHLDSLFYSYSRSRRGLDYWMRFNLGSFEACGTLLLIQRLDRSPSVKIWDPHTSGALYVDCTWQSNLALYDFNRSLEDVESYFPSL